MSSSAFGSALSECEALLSRALGVDGFKVVVKKYKTKIAFCDLETRTVYLNENLLDLGEDVVKYLLARELIHLKLGSRFHSEEFYKLFYTVIQPEEASRAERKIVKKLLEMVHAGGVRDR